MFTTITTISEPKNFFGKLKHKLLPPPIKSEIITVPDGCGFLHLEVPLIRGEIQWSNVKTVAGQNAANLVLPKWITPPDGNRIKAFKSIDLPRRITVNSIIKLLSMRKNIMNEIAVIDYMGGCAGLLEKLPEYSAGILIVTAKPERYESVKRSAMNTYGVTLRITDDISKAFDCPLVMIPSPMWSAVAFSRLSVIIAADSRNIYSSNVYLANGINLEQRYLDLLPEGVSPLYFASALYEISGVKSIKYCFSPVFSKNNHIFTYYDVLKSLD